MKKGNQEIYPDNFLVSLIPGFIIYFLPSISQTLSSEAFTIAIGQTLTAIYISIRE
jgi:hypothetical protein